MKNKRTADAALLEDSCSISITGLFTSPRVRAMLLMGVYDERQDSSVMALALVSCKVEKNDELCSSGL